jgi:hypothetical protein
MGIVVLVGFLIGCFAVLIVLERGDEAWLSWQVRRAGSGTSPDPESHFVVRLDDQAVVCERPDRTTERIAWDRLNRIEIVSTGAGPSRPDTFWLLTGEAGACAVPWGASGESALLARLQQLPGFDNQAVILAASESRDARRTCWERGRGSRPQAHASA